jgi:hypothetical protein
MADVHPWGASIGEGNSDSEEVAAVHACDASTVEKAAVAMKNGSCSYLGCQYWDKAAERVNEWQLCTPRVTVYSTWGKQL